MKRIIFLASLFLFGAYVCARTNAERRRQARPQPGAHALHRGLRASGHAVELGLYQDDRRLPQTHARTQLRPVRKVPRLHLHLHGGTPLPHDEGVLPRPLRQDARLRAPGAVDRRRLLRRGERGERLLVRVDDPRSPLRQRLLRAGIRLPQHRLHVARLLRLRRLDAERTGPCGHRRILHAETHVALGRRHPRST